MCSNSTSPRSTRSGWASSRSTTLRGRAMVCMPSWTWPMFSKMPPTTHMIQPDMLLMRITSPVARAMAPTEIAPGSTATGARPVVPVISTPFITVMVTSMEVTTRPARCDLRVWSPTLRGRSPFLAGVGEQLQRGDVGVAVDDPPHQLRARIRGLHRAALDLGNEAGEGADVGEHPQHQRDHQAPVGSANSTRALTV